MTKPIDMEIKLAEGREVRSVQDLSEQIHIFGQGILDRFIPKELQDPLPGGRRVITMTDEVGNLIHSIKIHTENGERKVALRFSDFSTVETATVEYSQDKSGNSTGSEARYARNGSVTYGRVALEKSKEIAARDPGQLPE